MRQATWAIVAAAMMGSAIQAEVKTRTIPYQHGDVQFEGVLAWDDAVEGKRPGVLIVHEWWGLDKYAKGRAEQLAKLGYVAFALDMYGKGKLAEHPMEAQKFAGEVRMNVKEWQARAQKGLEVLNSQEQCDPARVAAMGYCFGGSTVLQLAYTGADVKAVVSFHGAPVTPTDDQVKQTRARILICHGADDSFIPQKNLKAMTSALEKGKAAYRLEEYPGAVHSFTVPDVDKRNMPGMKYNKAADEKSWKSMLSLFDETLKKSGSP